MGIMNFHIVTAKEALQDDPSEEQILLEQSPAHYPEFDAFLRKHMESGALYFRGMGGMYYKVDYVESDPDMHTDPGVRISALLPEIDQTLSGDSMNRDIWLFLEWLIEGVGEPWSVVDLRKTGSIYKIPGAPARFEE